MSYRRNILKPINHLLVVGSQITENTGDTCRALLVAKKAMICSGGKNSIEKQLYAFDESTSMLKVPLERRVQ